MSSFPNIYLWQTCSVFSFLPFIQEDISAIFSKADKNNTGKLNVKDLKEVVKDICERYPQVEIYLNKKQLKNINVLLKNAEEDPKKASMEFDIEKFKKALSEVDSQMKHLPATAQVKLKRIYFHLTISSFHQLLIWLFFVLWLFLPIL